MCVCVQFNKSKQCRIIKLYTNNLSSTKAVSIIYTRKNNHRSIQREKKNNGSYCINVTTATIFTTGWITVAMVSIFNASNLTAITVTIFYCTLDYCGCGSYFLLVITMLYKFNFSIIVTSGLILEMVLEDYVLNLIYGFRKDII